MNPAILSAVWRLTTLIVATAFATSCADHTSSTAPHACPSPSNKILVDGSHDGGVWWFPQSGPFVADSPHQGKALAEYLRSKGYVVDELGRDAVVDAARLAGYSKVIRAGGFEPYSALELQAYSALASCSVTILVLGEFLSPGDLLHPPQEDPLAVALGVALRGTFYGNITNFTSHPITAGVSSVPFITGSEVDLGVSHPVQVLGWLDSGRPVMGIVLNQPAKIFFIGDTNGIEGVPQPLVDNLVAWGF
jgi:hypothetical protein